MDKVTTPNAISNQGCILIVDDDPDVLKLVCNFLLSHGYEVYRCSSGKEALEAFKVNRFDLIVTDLVMPEMNGLELLRSSLEIDPFLLGIILTGHGTIQSAVEAMKAGAFDYILKPFNFDELLCTVSRALEVHRLRESEIKYRTLTKELEKKVQELEKFHKNAIRLELKVTEMKEELEEVKQELNDFKSMEMQSFYNDF